MSDSIPLTRRRLALRLVVALTAAGLAWGALALAAPATPPAPGPTSLIPAFLVIALALALRAVLVALSAAVLSGAILAAGTDVVPALRDTIVGPAVTNGDNLLVIGFALALVATVRLLTVTGGLAALMRPFSRLAGSRRGSQAAAATMATTASRRTAGSRLRASPRGCPSGSGTRCPTRVCWRPRGAEPSTSRRSSPPRSTG